MADNNPTAHPWYPDSFRDYKTKRKQAAHSAALTNFVLKKESSSIYAGLLVAQLVKNVPAGAGTWVQSHSLKILERNG